MDASAIGVDEYSHKGHNSITVFLSHPDKLTDRQRKRLSQLLKIEYLDTVQSYSEEMIVAFAGMASKFANSPGREIRKFAACLTRNAVEILNSL